MAHSTRPTRLDYCQYLVSSQINYTLTNFADHSRKFSHDQLNRYLRDDKLTPRLVWEQTRGQIRESPNGYLIFDDTVADKNHYQQHLIAEHQLAIALMLSNQVPAVKALIAALDKPLAIIQTGDFVQLPLPAR
jgi:hypothetical protein